MEQLNDKKIETFITETEKNEALWNPRTESYKNIKLKNDLWAAIAAALELENGKLSYNNKFLLLLFSSQYYYIYILSIREERKYKQVNLAIFDHITLD